MSDMLTEEDFDVVDREALNRALELTLAEDEPGRSEQVRSMLTDDGWWYASSFCAYHQQCKTLNLKPWESPPCHVDQDNPNDHPEAVRLLRRMLKYGISRYDPTPIDSVKEKRGA
jgi:hypothetical protein